MHIGSLGRAAAEHGASEGDATPKLHQSRFRRSKLAGNPLLALNTNTTRGRLVHDTAVQLLAGVAEPDNPLTIADAVALAELRVRAGEMRRDPNSDLLALVRIEGLIDRRTRRLGLDSRRRASDSDRGLGALLVDEHVQDGGG
jgi:hypothetical protein